MKNLLMILFFLTLSYSVSNAICVEGCNDPEWSITEDEWTIGETDCKIWVRYEHRVVTCNDVQYNEVRLIGWVAAIDANCAEFEYPQAVIEFIYLQLFTGDLPGLITPISGCRSTYVVSGPACWEMVYKPIGPSGAGYYGQPCASTPTCCRHYQLCRDPFGNLSLTPLSYTPVPCGAVIGPESHMPCHSNCQ